MFIQVNENNLFDTISRVYHVAVLIYDNAGKVFGRFSQNPESDEVLLAISNCRERLLRVCAQTRQPQIVSSEINQLWAAVPVLVNDRIVRLVVLGPVHSSEFSKNLAVDYVRSYQFSPQRREELLEALEQIPVCPYVELTRLLSMIYRLMVGSDLDTSLLTISGLVDDEFTFADELHLYQESRAHPEDDFHDSYDFELHLLECVREGNLPGLKRLLRTASYKSVEPSSQRELVRQQKNSFVILVTGVIRAAVEGGLNPQIAYSLRELYIQRGETVHTLPAFLKLHREILYEMTIRMSNLKHARHYSKAVNDCCDYIDEHVREKLLVTDVAAFVGLHPHYLSRRFRKETGQTVKDYIRDTKISEAKSLLRYSRLSLTEISELLSFSSQSSFTYTFRQATGITPDQFRKSVET